MAGTVIAPVVDDRDSARRDVPAARGAGRSASTPRTSAPRSTPTDADIEKFYKDPANAAQFRAPEQATIEYVVLDLDALKKGITVSEDELRKYYAENEKRYTVAEERRASHILIKAEKGSRRPTASKAKAKAEALLAEAEEEPGGLRRAGEEELATTPARPRRAATSTSSAAARWSSRSRTRPSR